MVTDKELTEAIEELGASAKKLGSLLRELGNVELVMAYDQHALRGFYHFCQECALITQDIVLEDIP